MGDSGTVDDRLASGVQRRAGWITGIVQGVGFRPFVHRTAVGLGLTGFVRNQSGLVYLEAEGSAARLNEFARIIAESPPRLAKIASIRWQPIDLERSKDFQIAHSVATSVPQVTITPDAAVCSECVSELFDSTNRRYLYPFINCMNCGPRLTIIRGAPYDRSRTTMSSFPLCAACRAEYDDPLNRRFHAQPIACSACGPRLQLVDKAGAVIASRQPIEDFAAAIAVGKIGALKGLGGYHIVCDASVDSVAAELRRRKQRDEKPFAVMVADLESAQTICELNTHEADLLLSAQAPIVLLRRRDSINSLLPIAQAVAPGNPFLGVMVPYTPLHHLLLRAVNGRPLVMTSGNRSDEPMAHDEADAVERLGPIVDLFLTHNRPIQVRCDDSVLRSTEGQTSLLRRSRGFAPEPLILPQALTRQTLALGGQLKSTFALGRDRLAFVSHHLGDLDHLSAYQAFERDLGLYERLFDMQVELLVHDLHPDYASTGFALRRGDEQGLQRLAVQHHHAHVASAMAEHGLDGPVIGVAFDGTGYGLDGAIWGGEFLVATYAGFQRAAHLRYVGLPGGDAAIREPWRCAAAHLRDAGCELPAPFAGAPASAVHLVQQMLDRQFNTPPTSSMGRLFDAVSSMIGIRSFSTYEGQAAIELEFCASTAEPAEGYPFELMTAEDSNPAAAAIIDTRPTIQAIVDDLRSQQTPSLIAHRFHSTIASMVVTVCGRLRQTRALEQVVLSGGVFSNELLAKDVTQKLSADGFRVYRQVRVPCNDGGLSFGQLAIAAAND
jgi:hydrogenase maturation protein HypF